MKIDFFQANEQKAPTVEHFLFSDSLSVVMNGMYIQREKQNYIVVSQLIPEEKTAALIVFITPMPYAPANVMILDEE